ncbi:ribosome maturation factor RimM [bacterium]|nr:ribosome maturation factor RimM [bacterium]
MALIPLGKIYREHGLKGELKILLYNPQSENLVKGKKYQLELEGNTKEVTLKTFKMMSPHVLVQFVEINSMTESEKWRQAKLLVDEKLLKPLKSGEYYLQDLFGKKVKDENGLDRGVLKGLEGDGKNMFLSVQKETGDFLIPYVADWIRKVEGDIVILHIPEGLE